MSELKMVSPLLDNLLVVKSLGGGSRSTCYLLENSQTQAQYVLKHIAVPDSQDKVQALLLTGAVADEESAQNYYQGIVDDMKREIHKLQSLSGHSSLGSWTGYQIEPRENAVGFDVYLLMPCRQSLAAFLKDHAITQLQALNLGIDLCDALCTLRDAGYLYQNLKPENVFVDQLDRYMLGDLGIVALEDLPFSAIPDSYLSDFSAPELFQLLGELNTTIDVYSLGMTLYYIFNGNHLPFEDEEHTPKEARESRLHAATLPAPLYADYELSEIIQKACAQEPEDRYQNPSELRQALTLYMQRNSVTDQLLVPPISTEDAPVTTAEDLDADLEEEAEAAEETAETEEAEATEETAETEETEAAEETAETEEAEAAEETAETEEVEATEETAETEEAETTEETAETEEAEATGETLEAEAAETTEETVEAEEATVAESVEAAVELAVAEAVKVTEETDAAETAAAPKTAETAETDETQESEELPAEPVEESLDALLADVSSMIREKSIEELTYAEEIAEEKTALQPESGKRRKKVWIPILIVTLVLAILLGGGYWFYRNWYTIKVTSLEVTEKTMDSITVSYSMNRYDSGMIWTCMDTYGNSSNYSGTASEGSVSFTGLRSGMQYTISCKPGKYHRFVGPTSLTVGTTATTEVISFTATPGVNSTTAEINLVLSGPEPESWTLTYTSEDSDSGSLEFSGHTAAVSGLQLHKTYTFELQPPQDFNLTGQTTAELTMTPNVKAADLLVADATENTLTVIWNSIGDETPKWTVSCAGGDYSKTLDVTTCEATFEGISLETAYVFTLKAEDMAEPLSITLPANATVVTGFTGQATENGDIEASWTFSGDMPEGGWKIHYAVGVNASAGASITTEESAAKLYGMPADAVITLELLAADGQTLIGNKPVEVRTPAAVEYTGNGFSTEATSLDLYPLPEGENWTAKDLSRTTNDFKAGEVIAFALTAPEDFTADSEEELHIAIALRNEAGDIVDYTTEEMVWNTAWTDGKYLGTIPAPTQEGTYRMEFYFNGYYVCRHVVNVAGAAAQQTAEG